MARRYGYSIGGKLGELAFQEQELAYVNSLLPKFSNNPIIRMKQHLLLYWSQSYFKTTLVDEFCRCIPRTVSVINITSNSPETLFGSINEKDKIVYPAFVDTRIAKITELSTFVTGKNSQEIVNTMNKAMEGEEVTRQLLKFGRRDISSNEINKAESRGICYDPSRAQLSYKPEVSIFACSRPLDNKTYTYLRSSGHLYRYHILQHEIGNEEVKKYLTENFKPDSTLREQLTELNKQLASISVKEINVPEESVQREIFGNLIGYVEDESRNGKTKLASIVDLRTKGDILRELVAHATIRTFHENSTNNVEKIEYTAEDLEFIISNTGHFVEAKLNPLFTEEWSKKISLKQRPKQLVKEFILKFLADGNERSRKEIADYIHSKINVSEATISNALKELEETEQILHRHGYYRLPKRNALMWVHNGQ